MSQLELLVVKDWVTFKMFEGLRTYEVKKENAKFICTFYILNFQHRCLLCLLFSNFDQIPISKISCDWSR